MKLDRRSLILLLVQLAIISSIAAKYLYQRHTCPRVWTRAVAYDPELVLRGRYLSMQLYIDACAVKLPAPASYSSVRPHDIVLFNKGGIAIPYQAARIGARDGRLSVINLMDPDTNSSQARRVQLREGSGCSEAFLEDPVDFYIPEHVQSPFPLKPGTHLWVEVTIPPKGPPRPLNLALNDNGRWQPLNF